MKKISGKLLTAVPYIISIILNLALYAAGTVCAVRGFLYGRLLLWIFVALLAVCLLSSVLGSFLYTRRFKRMAQDEILHYVLSSTQKLHRAEQQAERSLLRLKNGVIAYLGFVILLTLAIPFFFGAADFGAGSSNVLLLFSVYIQADFDCYRNSEARFFTICRFGGVPAAATPCKACRTGRRHRGRNSVHLHG